MNPNFDYEQSFWTRGLKLVAGADEVGRGAFAGPVVAAAVVFDPLNISWPESVLIRDSKKMTPKQREKSATWIKSNCLGWGVGIASVSEINKHGIIKSTQKAFRRSIANCKLKIEYLLLDAFFVPYTKGLAKSRQTPIIHGDALSCSIAAASIIAKCHRDNIMQSLGAQSKFKYYKWEQNAGYGTASHQQAILKHGTSPQHRTAYLSKLFASQG